MGGLPDLQTGIHADLDDDRKAEVLIEALPWLEEFSGQRIVVKYGGNAMVDEHLKRCFAQDMVFLRQVGMHPVVVHGGGPQITRMLDALGIESVFRGGLRVTTPETMEVVRMVLTGQVSRDLVGLINTHGPFAVGLSGEDASLFSASRCQPLVGGKPVDVGLVGEVVGVDASAVEDLIEAGRIPVVSSVAPDENDPTQVLNVNADAAAGALASALGARKLVILTNVEGLYREWPKKESLVSSIGTDYLEEVMDRMQAGMKPKLEACVQAVRGGVEEAHIIDGRRHHSILNEIFTKNGIGTMVVPGDGIKMRGTHDHRGE